MASTIQVDTIKSTTSNVFFQNSAGTEYARFDSSGNMGIGTSSPSTKLHLYGTTDQRIRFENTGWTKAYHIGNDQNALSFYDVTSAVERMRIDSSGNVGIGSSSPVGKLDVYAASGPAVYVRDATVQSLIGTDTSTAYYGTNGAYPVRFLTNNTERMRINAGAPILCLSGGNTSATGTGIAFPATQSASSDANTLDDYEEGTWTPSLGGTATYSSRTAQYTKIGDTVRAYFDVTVSTIGTGSPNTMSGFPFVATNNDAGAISYFNVTATAVVFLQTQMSSSSCLFVGCTAAQSNITNGINVWGNGTRILGTIVYKTST